MVKMRSNLTKYINAQKLGKSFLISGHLWIEHLLVRSLVAKLPNPDAIFRDRAPSFHMLVALCEGHAIIERELADAIRLINSMRNKSAHHLHYEPTDSEFRAVRAALEKIGETLPPVAPDEWGEPIEIAAAMLERRARGAGATDIEAPIPEDGDGQV